MELRRAAAEQKAAAASTARASIMCLRQGRSYILGMLADLIKAWLTQQMMGRMSSQDAAGKVEASMVKDALAE